MNWFDEWTLEQEKKKKKKDEDQKASASSQQKNEDLAPAGGRSALPATSPYSVPNSGTPVTAPLGYSPMPTTSAYQSGLQYKADIAPVKKDDDKPKWYEGYLKKGAFADGKQKGDTGKAALGTSTDIAKNLLTGAAL